MLVRDRRLATMFMLVFCIFTDFARAQRTLDELAGETVRLSHRYDSCELIVGSRFGDQQKKSLTFGAITFLTALREHDPKMSASVKSGRDGELILEFPIRMTNPDLDAQVRVEVQDDVAGTSVAMILKADRVLSKKDLAGCFDELVLKGIVAPSLKNAVEGASFFDAIGGFYTMDEYFVKRAKMTGRPEPLMNESEVLAVFGRPTTKSRVWGLDTWHYESKDDHGLTRILSVKFDRSGLVSDYNQL